MLDGEKIKSLRDSISLSQAELGEEVGVSQSAISQYERGVKTPELEVLVRIAQRLGCTVDELIIKT